MISKGGQQRAVGLASTASGPTVAEGGRGEVGHQLKPIQPNFGEDELEFKNKCWLNVKFYRVLVKKS